VDPAVDVSANDDVLASGGSWEDGYGVRRDGSQHPLKLLETLPVIRKYNRHGIMIFNRPKSKQQKTSSPAVSTAERIAEETIYRDLEADRPPETIPLNIGDRRIYFEARTLTDEANSSQNSSQLDQTMKMFQDEVTACRRSTTEIAFKSSLPVLLEISMSARSELKATEESEILLPDGVKTQIFVHFWKANELLRHFYSCLASSSLPKATKIAAELAKVYDNVQSFRLSVPPEHRSLVGQLLSSIMPPLEAAIERQESASRK